MGLKVKTGLVPGRLATSQLLAKADALLKRGERLLRRVRAGL